MKTIYVTITEFEENGGVLENGRDVYSFTINRAQIGVYKFNQVCINTPYIHVVNGGTVRAIPRHLYYVAIECTPIYK